MSASLTWSALPKPQSLGFGVEVFGFVFWCAGALGCRMRSVVGLEGLGLR